MKDLKLIFHQEDQSVLNQVLLPFFLNNWAGNGFLRLGQIVRPVLFGYARLKSLG